MNLSSSRPWALAAIPLVMCGCAAMTGCDDKVSAHNAKVKIAGKSFYLETAMDGEKRFRGLSERTNIEEDGGMLFVFPNMQSNAGGFVMRDCPIPIDIIYLDHGGRVLTMHAMLPEAPRGPGEGKPGQRGSDPPSAENELYNGRLKQWASRYPYQFVIELKGGKLKTLNLKEGDQVDFDREGLIKQSR